MGIEITVSSKGQIVIPKGVREALGLRAGEKLVMERVGRRLILEAPRPAPARISYAEFRRRVPRYEGPPVPVETMTDHIGELYRDWKA